MKTRLIKTSLLALLLFVFGAAGNAFASFPEPGVSYRITEKNTQKCLDVSGGSLNVAPVGVWNCGAQTSQKWQLRLIEDGAYQITAQHSLMSLDVEGGIGWPFANNGVSVQQYPFNYGRNQEWRLTEANDGYYYIVARFSGKLLTIINGVGKQWEQRADFNQKFKFTPYPGPCS
jgi:hypothetical protein